MNIADFLVNYVKEISFDKQSNGYDLNMPFRLFNDEVTITLHIQENPAGYYDIDDKGNTFRYLENLDVDIKDYRDRVEIICSMFSLKIEDKY